MSERDEGLVERLFLDSVIVATDTARSLSTHAGNVLRRLNLKFGPLHLTPEGFDDVRRLAVNQIRNVLDIPNGGHDSSKAPPLPDPVEIARAMLELGAPPAASADQDLTIEEEVRRRFSALLDPERDHEGQRIALPALVGQLGPDEARILRYLHHAGEAPVVDVYAVPTLGRGSTLVAESLSVVVERAGGDQVDRGPALLANLARLGLVKVSRRELSGHGDYQLIEASPEFEAAEHHARDELGQRAKAVRRSVRLTPLGRELCRIALGSEGSRPEDDDTPE